MPNPNNKKTGFGLSRFRRNHYFRGKLLTARDFEAEQDYINEKRHLLNRVIDGVGLICGLTPADVVLSNSGGNIKIKFVTGGAAIDGWGREIVVPIEDNPRDIWVKQGPTPGQLTLADLENDPYYLYLEYSPQEAEMVNSASENSSCGETCSPNRVIEDFEVIASLDKPDMQTIGCPDFTGETSGVAVKKAVKKWLSEQTAGLCTVPGDGRIFFLALSKGSTITIDPQKTEQYLTSVTNNRALSELLACHVSDFENPHKTTASQLGALTSVDGVGNPGGNVDLVNANTITITPDNTGKKITVGETHSTRTDNPHNTTALQVGALKSVDGVSNPGGNVDLEKDNSIIITPDITGKKITIGETHSARTDNPHNTTALQMGALQSVDGVSNPGGNVDLEKDNSIIITPDITGKKITIGETHSARTDNPHNTTALQVGALKSVNGVETPGGNVDLVKGNSITITPDITGKKITIGENHSSQTGNPHQTKHEDIKDALPVFGDTDNDTRNKHISNDDAEKWNSVVEGLGLKSINKVENPGGNIDLIGKNSLTITPDPTAKSIAIGENHSTRTDNPHKTTAEQVGALSLKGGAVEGNVSIKGNVDLATVEPFHVTSGNTVAGFESTGDEAHLILTTKEGFDNRVHIVNRAGGRAAIRSPHNVRPKDAFSVLANGNVGVGTEVPDSTLSVVGERGVDFPLDGNQIAAAFYGSPGSNGRPIVVVNRGNRGEDGVNYGPLINFLFHEKKVGSITVNENGVLSYLAFTGSHLAWSKETPGLNILVSMTGENKPSIEGVPTSEPIYGVVATTGKNDRKVLGTVFSTENGQTLVAAVGNHFIWVADNGKDIRVGDALISSAVPGHAENDLEEDKYSYVVGRAADNVKWQEIKDSIEVDVDGKKQMIKHTLISVLFGFYEKRNI